MLNIRTRAKAVVAAGAVTLLAAEFAATAVANRVQFDGKVTGHPRVVMGFVLVGSRCPSGAHCFDHAKVTEFSAENISYPDCPQLLEGGFDFGAVRTLDKRSVRVDRRRSFNFHGPGGSDPQVHGSVHGQFLKHGAKAKGWFEVYNGPCTTGRLNWTATRG
jgi:hypothetical protein